MVSVPLLLFDFALWAYVVIFGVLVYFTYLLSNKELISIPVLYCVYFIYFIGLGPIATRIIPLELPDTIRNLIPLAYALWLFGYVIPQHSNSIGTKEYIFKSNYQYFRLFSVILLLISSGTLLVYIFRIMPFYLNEGIENGRISAQAGNGLMIFLSSLWRFAGGMLYELELKKYRSVGNWWIVIVLCLILQIFLGSRTSVLAFLILLILMRSRYKKFKVSTVFACGLAIVMFACIYAYIRNEGNTNLSIVSPFFSASGVQMFNLNSVFRAFPDSVPFQGGYTYIINLLLYRPGPDVDFTLWLKEQLGMNFAGGGVTPTVIGEAYINFGYFGIVIFMIVVGVLVKKMQYSYKNSSYIFMISFIAVSFFGTVGAGLGSMISILPYILLFFIMKLFVRVFQSSNAEKYP
jgi:oligosaccharide repeat unit polymerase